MEPFFEYYAAFLRSKRPIEAAKAIFPLNMERKSIQVVTSVAKWCIICSDDSEVDPFACPQNERGVRDADQLV